MQDLFFGMGIGHSILLFAFVIAVGLFLGKFKIKGVTIGSTWILFVGIIMSHFGFRVPPLILSFVKDLGLILFVFSIGLQVGPGFFHSLKKGGLTLNMLAITLVMLSVVVTCVIHLVTGESIANLTGVMSGAVTNTPGLGAAQQTLTDVGTAVGTPAEELAQGSSQMGSAYAVAYPVGVLGVLFLLVIFKSVFKIDLSKERKAMEKDDGNENQATSICCQVENPAAFGKTLSEISKLVSERFIVSRLYSKGKLEVPGPDTILEQDDIVLVVTSVSTKAAITLFFGKEANMDRSEWDSVSGSVIARRLVITKSSLNGRKLSELNIRNNFGVNITRVIRAGVELVARPSLYLQVGDSVIVVGPEKSVDKTSEFVGNRTSSLNHANIMPIFFGIVIGIIFGSIPFRFPGIPQAVKLGIAGGPLIIAILLGYFGPRWKITTYTTLSANMMIREIGISLFLAAVGIGAGENFFSALVNGGYNWILYGALITIIPVSIIMLVARFACHLNFYQICGLVAGGTTNPPVLSFAQGAYGTDYTSVNYATVYPLTMFLRVLMPQLLILMAIS